MKNVAVIFNTNQLGGAERSLIEQLHLVSGKYSFYFFIPKLGLSDSDLRNFINSKGIQSIDYYPYPSFLYKLSRKNLHLLPLVTLLSPLLVWYLFQWHLKFKKFSYFYVNGNKAVFPIFAWTSFFRKKISVFWHFRDFPSKKAFQIIGRLVSIFFKDDRLVKLKLIANSYAVQNDLKRYFPDKEIQCLYNLPGYLPVRQKIDKIKHIGIASMFAPWKGLHSLLLMIGLYENELRKIGIEKISFFGDEIYQTNGEHNSYSLQLKELCNKLNISLVSWPGRKSPQEIFADIDLLIHPSISPEPFGRVIIEAFKARVPVVSSCLGGSGELIEQGKQGFKWELYDYQGLFNLLRLLQTRPDILEKVIKEAASKLHSIEATLHVQVENLID